LKPLPKKIETLPMPPALRVALFICLPQKILVMKYTLLIVAMALGLLWECHAQEGEITRKVASMEKYDGFFPFYWEARRGKIWLEIDTFDQEFLYVSSLPAGVGSNDIGLDRGQLGSEKVVKFVRSGPKILLIEPNYRFRANSQNLAERRSVEEAFAQSVIWGFELDSEEEGRVLVDATAFFMHDAHDVAGKLQNTRQGSYRPDLSRSAFYLPRTKNFPKNTEIEATLTFTGTPSGNYIRSVTPTPEAVTVRQHYSFIELPDNLYKPRAYDPRSGYYAISYMDFATPFTEPIQQKIIARHRLEKKNPNARISEAVKPIVYYLDPGTPEPVRTALLEGARWWNQAFEAIGFKDAFQVTMLPEGADPMDVRYNLIQWVHRSTRGWSYGMSVRDPRTGEILKGHVTLGSLRVRQDYLLAEGLIASYEEGKKPDPAMEAMALARLRQLSAHEVGHTLGLMHNFAASKFNRSSVMDYPHPLVLERNGKIDLSQAYAEGIGEWDKITIAYGYQQFPNEAAEKTGLKKIIDDYIAKGFVFITDYDSRATGGSHPDAHLWDNGVNSVEELARVMRLRQTALNQFSEKKIRPGAPMATLEETLVPVYLMHRYQAEAAAKLIGGANYTYALRGDKQVTIQPLPASEQSKALDGLLETLTPDALVLPERIIQLIPPRPPAYPRNRETFPASTGVTFDPTAAAQSATAAILSLILHPERAARLVEFHARDASQLSLEAVVDRISERLVLSPPPAGYPGEIQRMVARQAVYAMMALASDSKTTDQAKAISRLKLAQLASTLGNRANNESQFAQQAHLLFLQDEIARFLKDPTQKPAGMPSVNMPDGAPIGQDQACDWPETW
jgi:hypothetical protein